MRSYSSRKHPARKPRKDIDHASNGSSAGSKILAAIQEATELMRTEGLRSKRLTVRSYQVPEAPQAYLPVDVKRVRDLLCASQAILAGFLGVNVNTVRSWEQGKRRPQPIACRFLAEIESDPEYWRKRIARQR
jgi:putative transcriptional regulator